jgi:hypothetical protein
VGIRLRRGMFETELPDMAAVRAGLAEGRLGPDDEIWDALRDGWRPVGEVVAATVVQEPGARPSSAAVAAQYHAGASAATAPTAAAANAGGGARTTEPASVRAPAPQASKRWSSKVSALVWGGAVILAGALVVAVLVVRTNQAVAVVDCANFESRLRQCRGELLSETWRKVIWRKLGDFSVLVDDANREAASICRSEGGRFSDGVAVNACLQTETCEGFAGCISTVALWEQTVRRPATRPATSVPGVRQSVASPSSPSAPPQAAPAHAPPVADSYYCCASIGRMFRTALGPVMVLKAAQCIFGEPVVEGTPCRCTDWCPSDGRACASPMYFYPCPTPGHLQGGDTNGLQVREGNQWFPVN